MIGLLVPFQALAERVLNSIPEGLILVLLAWAVLRFVGRQNSGTRFAVWFVALVAIACIPLLPAAHMRGSLATARPELTLPASWAVIVLLVWGAVAFVGMARLAFGLTRLAALRSNSVPVLLEELPEALRATVEECRRIRSVELRVSPEVKVPAAIGFFRPVILLPTWALDELSGEELRTLVLHEFAHLRRRDDWTNLTQKTVRALFFFHPAVLWVDRRLSLEREMACDDAVIATTRDPDAYARCLVSVAEKTFVQRSIALVQAAISRASDTTERIAQILDGNRPTATHVVKPVLASIAALVAAGIVAAPYGPRLIGFKDPVKAGAGATMAAAAPEIPRLSPSMIVPAMARREPSASAATAASVVKAQRRNRPEVRHPAALYAKAELRNAQPQAERTEFLVVTQTTDYYQHGSAIVGVSVWRVTLVSAPVPTRNARQVERPRQT